MHIYYLFILQRPHSLHANVAFVNFFSTEQGAILKLLIDSTPFAPERAGKRSMILYNTLKTRLSSMRFRNKIIVVFAIVLVLIIGFVSLQQVYMINQLRFRDTQDNLSLITEQVGVNFSKSLSEQEMRLYSTMKMFDLPVLIRTSQNSGSLTDTRLALNQMLSTTSPFDFLMIRTTNDVVLSATNLRASSADIATEASSLLEGPSEAIYNSYEWHRGQNGGAYVIRDIYDTSPLTYCGRIVAHVKDNYVFSLGAQTRELEYTFLFFTPSQTSEYEFLLAVGLEDNALINEIARLHEQGQLNGQRITINGNSYFVSSTVHDSIKTVGLTPLSRVQSSNAVIARSSIAFGVVGMIGGIVVLLLLMRPLMRQLNSLTNAMDALASGNLDQTIPVVSIDDIGQLAAHFNNLSSKISLLLQRVVREETLKTKAQFTLLEYRYRSLQTQLNPHFIFNALETINAMSKLDGNTELNRNILQISHYFRLVTNNMNRQFITIGEELASLKDYAQIHQSIQANSLDVTFFCEDAVTTAVIPTMSLQPILENALVHGLCSAPFVSAVSVRARMLKGKRVQLSVCDNGRGITPDQKDLLLSKKPHPPTENHTGIGLYNVMERLELLYGNDAQVQIDSEPGNTCISVTLPLSYEAPLEFDKFSI